MKQKYIFSRKHAFRSLTPCSGLSVFFLPNADRAMNKNAPGSKHTDLGPKLHETWGREEMSYVRSIGYKHLWTEEEGTLLRER